MLQEKFCLNGGQNYLLPKNCVSATNVSRDSHDQGFTVILKLFLLILQHTSDVVDGRGYDLMTVTTNLA